MEFGVRHYPQLEIDLDKLEDNLRALKSRMDASGIRLAGVVKGFNGLPQAAKVYEKAGYSSIASSRLEQLHQSTTTLSLARVITIHNTGIILLITRSSFSGNIS